MRVNEALSLDRSDVDLERGILHIRLTKFRKSRYVPVHSTTVAALKKYAEARDRLFPAPSTPAFFISERGRRIPAKTAQYNFAKVSQQVGLRVPAKNHSRGPRLHDLRHPIRHTHVDPVVSRRPGCRTRAAQTVRLPGACSRERYLLVSRSSARTPSVGYRSADPTGGATVIAASFPSLLQSFFTDRLLRQRQASPHTIAGYRDCFRLLLQFAKERLGKMPSHLRIEDLDAPFIVCSLTIWNVLGKTALALGMRGWAPSTPSSGMWL